MSIEKVQIGGTRVYTWVNSGVTVDALNHAIYLRDATDPGSASEILVSSKAASNSGNGLYYSLAQINTPGIYVSEWNATIGANLYKERLIYQGISNTVDKIGRYIDWGDVLAMFPQAGRGPSAEQVNSYHILYAEAEVDGLLASNYSTPFSHTNLTVKELATIATFLRMGILKDSKYDDVSKMFYDRIQRINDGKEAMLVSSSNGNIAAQFRDSGAWSSTMNYSPTFNMLPVEYQNVSSSQLQDEYDDIN